MAAGEQVFKPCGACHAVGPGAGNKAGPELNGVVGRTIASVEGYGYSDALKTFGEGRGWDEATLDKARIRRRWPTAPAWRSQV